LILSTLTTSVQLVDSLAGPWKH